MTRIKSCAVGALAIIRQHAGRPRSARNSSAGMLVAFDLTAIRQLCAPR